MTYAAIQNHTIFEDWKQDWYGGFGATALFGMEDNTQVFNYIDNHLRCYDIPS